MADVVYPKTTCWVSESIMLVQGEPWDAADPFVRANPQHFTESSGRAVRGSGRVERATAEPGEKRNARRGPRTTADKSDTDE